MYEVGEETLLASVSPGVLPRLHISALEASLRSGIRFQDESVNDAWTLKEAERVPFLPLSHKGDRLYITSLVESHHGSRVRRVLRRGGMT